MATGKGYTKHYYAESERIASRIGGGRLYDLDQPIVGNEIIDEKKEHVNNQTTDVLGSCLDVRWYDVETDIHKLYDWRDNVQHESDCYWYHPDHLGSSSWITDSAGAAVQHLHYLPWGEDFVNQRTSSFSSMYTFSAKEKDAETGYSYFGARYYSSDLSVWLSVDPMAAKYPSLSPYTYCADNPVRCVDPNGEEWFINEDGYIKVGENKDDHNVYFVKGKKNEFGEHQKDSKDNDVAVDIGDDIHQWVYSESGYYKDKSDGNKVKPYTAHTFDISDLAKAQKLFRCMSNYTDNEWSFWGDNKGFHLSTSHIYKTDIYGGRLAKQAGENGVLLFFFHSHPRNEPSGMYTNDLDRETRDTCLAKSPNAVIGIMHKGILYDFTPNKIKWDGTKLHN